MAFESPVKGQKKTQNSRMIQLILSHHIKQLYMHHRLDRIVAVDSMVI